MQPQPVSEYVRKGRKLARLLRTSSYRQALRHHVAAAVEHEDLFLEHDPVMVIDVGANRGQFAVFARHRFPEATICCFEPLPGPRSVLEDLFAGEPLVRVRSEALGATAGTAKLHQTESDDSSSLLRPTATQRHYFPGSDEVGTVEVVTARLDAVITATEIRGPCLLKIDVQGAELEVLRGASSLLAAIDHVLVECSFVELYSGQALIGDVIELMRDEGYRFTGTGAPSRGEEGRPLQVDALFSRSEPSTLGD